MIKLERTAVYGWDAAIRGMRNPMNSWDKSDSFWDMSSADDDYVVGDNDLALMKKLSNAGNDHAKFLRMINVTVDITAPLYWWKEFDTYKVGTVANSCSTMHKIHDKVFEWDDFSREHLYDISMSALQQTIKTLNIYRDEYLKTKNKEYWWQMIQLLPSSYNQKRTIQLNYQVLKQMYFARRNHKLDEWHTFCEWIEGLPYAKEIICSYEERKKMNTYSVLWLNREVATVYADRVIADNTRMDFYTGNNIVVSFDRKFATAIKCYGERKEQK